MDYLNRLNDLEEVNDRYYEVVYDLIQTKMNNHFEQFYSAPRYLLVGENKLLEVGRILFIISNNKHIYEELKKNSNVKLYGMRIIFVANDINMLEVA